MAEKTFGKKVVDAVSRFIMTTVGLIQLFDFIFTSISINDFLGTGNTFKWAPIEGYHHVYGEPSPSQTFVYDNEDYHYKDALTKWGYRIMEQVAENPDDYLWASIGYFDSSRDPEMDMCGYFKGNYKNVKDQKARFMSMKEKLTLVRPLTLNDHFIHDTWDPETLTLDSMDSAQEYGFYGSRRAVELRMTARLDFNYTENKKIQIEDGTWKGYYEVTKPVKAVRYYGKSFCDGCQPIAELGQMFCELECKVTEGEEPETLHVEVHSSHRRAGTSHRMGVSFPNTSSSFWETFIRIVIMIYVGNVCINVLSNSVRSNEERYFTFQRQNADNTILMSSLVYRPYIYEFLQPSHNVCRSSSFSLSFVLYNSDPIIFGNLVVVAITFMTSMQLKHEIVWWAYKHETFRAVITRIGVNAKMLWLYIGFMKFYKLCAARFGMHEWTVKMCFNSQMFVWFWIMYLVLMTWTGMDFLLDPLFSDRIDIINNYELMNDISVRFQYGFYFIRVPAIAVHTIFVSLSGMIFLIILQDASGSAKRRNSLFRQMACGHSVLIYDASLFQDDIEKNTSFIESTKLMNLKWFLKTQSVKFPFIDKYGLYHGADSVQFSHEEDDLKKRTDNEKSGKANLYCSIINGKEGALHIVDRSTKEDFEKNPNYHELLDSNTLIKIR